MSWGWCLFTAVKKIAATWVGFTLGLIVGIGIFLALKTLGVKMIRHLNLNEPKLPLNRLLVVWFMCVATLLFAFIAPWGIHWLFQH